MTEPLKISMVLMKPFSLAAARLLRRVLRDVRRAPPAVNPALCRAPSKPGFEAMAWQSHSIGTDAASVSAAGQELPHAI